MDAIRARISANCDRIRARIEAAVGRSGREASSVHLVAVTKYAEPAWIAALWALGIRDFGESRPQQLADRAAMFDATTRWHLIGHLQSNKIRKLLPQVDLIHSVDSFRLLARIDQTARDLGLRPQALLEVNISGESSKNGFDPTVLRSEWTAIRQLPHIDVAGLMTMAPQADDPEAVRPVFRQLCKLREELAADSSQPLPELSMGMSGDFEVAIEEGATLVRIGSSLFDGLKVAGTDH